MCVCMCVCVCVCVCMCVYVCVCASHTHTHMYISRYPAARWWLALLGLEHADMRLFGGNGYGSITLSLHLPPAAGWAQSGSDALVI